MQSICSAMENPMSIDKGTLLTEFHLSTDIAELEKDVSSVWEPPDIYNDVMKDHVWLVYGRKGSGKYTSR